MVVEAVVLKQTQVVLQMVGLAVLVAAAAQIVLLVTIKALEAQEILRLLHHLKEIMAELLILALHRILVVVEGGRLLMPKMGQAQKVVMAALEPRPLLVDHL